MSVREHPIPGGNSLSCYGSGLLPSRHGGVEWKCMRCSKRYVLLEQNANLRLGLPMSSNTINTASAGSIPLLRLRIGSELFPHLRGAVVRGAPKEGVRLSPSSDSRGPNFCHLCLPGDYDHETYRTVVSPRSNVVLASGLRPSVLNIVPLHFNVPAGFRPFEHGILPVCVPVTQQQDHDLADRCSVGLIATLSDHPARDTMLRISGVDWYLYHDHYML